MKKKIDSYDQRWDQIQGKLVRYPLLVRYTDENLCPTDSSGFRLVNHQGPLEILKNNLLTSETVICIGGSTTFGWFVDYEFSYPRQLENLIDRAVLNLGIPGLDIKNSLEVLMQVLRLRAEKLIVVFLFGVNEKSGFLLAHEKSLQNFEITHNLYARFEKYNSNKRLNYRRNTYLNDDNISNERYTKFLNGQIAETHSYLSLINKICQAFKIKSYFFLQPHGLEHFGKSKGSLRFRYLTDLYKSLSSNNLVVDISKICLMNESDYIDWQHPNANGYKKISKTISQLL